MLRQTNKLTKNLVLRSRVKAYRRGIVFSNFFALLCAREHNGTETREKLWKYSCSSERERCLDKWDAYSGLAWSFNEHGNFTLFACQRREYSRVGLVRGNGFQSEISLTMDSLFEKHVRINLK